MASFLLVLGLVVAAAVLAAAGCPLVGGRPVVVAERLLAVAARAAGCLLVLGPTAAGRPHAVAVRPAERPAVAGPLGPCFVSRAAPRLRRRRRAAAVVREPREGLPALVLE